MPNVMREHKRDGIPAVGPLARELMYARLAAGKSQQEVGEAAGVAQHMVSAWEGCRSVPTVLSLTRWADALGYDVALVPRRAEP